MYELTFARKINSSSQIILLKSTRILPQPKNILQFVCKLLWNSFLSWAKEQIIVVDFKNTSEIFKPLKIKMHNQGIKYLIMACSFMQFKIAWEIELQSHQFKGRMSSEDYLKFKSTLKWQESCRDH